MIVVLSKKYNSFNNTDVYFQADRHRKTEIVPDFWDKVQSGTALCAKFLAENWHLGINVKKYCPHSIPDLPKKHEGRMNLSSWIVSIAVEGLSGVL